MFWSSPQCELSMDTRYLSNYATRLLVPGHTRYTLRWTAEFHIRISLVCSIPIMRGLVQIYHGLVNSHVISALKYNFQSGELRFCQSDRQTCLRNSVASRVRFSPGDQSGALAPGCRHSSAPPRLSFRPVARCTVVQMNCLVI